VRLSLLPRKIACPPSNLFFPCPAFPYPPSSQRIFFYLLCSFVFFQEGCSPRHRFFNGFPSFVCDIAHFKDSLRHSFPLRLLFSRLRVSQPQTLFRITLFSINSALNRAHQFFPISSEHGLFMGRVGAATPPSFIVPIYLVQGIPPTPLFQEVHFKPFFSLKFLTLLKTCTPVRSDSDTLSCDHPPPSEYADCQTEKVHPPYVRIVAISSSSSRFWSVSIASF